MPPIPRPLTLLPRKRLRVIIHNKKRLRSKCQRMRNIMRSNTIRRLPMQSRSAPESKRKKLSCKLKKRQLNWRRD